MQIPPWLRVQLKLAALGALSAVEARAEAALREKGVNLADKRQQAIALVMDQYAHLTAGTPLALTTMDDKVVEQLVGRVVDEAWADIGSTVNRYRHPPINNAPGLQPGHLE